MTPRNQERIFPKDYAAELLRIAQGDLRTAEFLLEGMKLGRIRDENLFLMAHQAIEKSLKAVICAFGQPVPLIHDMGVLVAKIPKDSAPGFGYELTQLSDFATRRRYEEGRVVLSIEEASDVLKTSAEIVQWAESQIKRMAGLDCI
jgi:HEPN domain-containing protein